MPRVLHQAVDPAGADTADITLSHHRHERLLRPATRVEQPVREVGTPAQLRDRQLDAPDPRVERAQAVAVAVVHPLRTHLPPPRPGDRVDLGGHQPPGELGHHLPQEIVLVTVELLAQPRQCVHVVVDHRVLPLVALRRNFKRLTRWSSRPGDLLPLHHYLGLNCVDPHTVAGAPTRKTASTSGAQGWWCRLVTAYSRVPAGLCGERSSIGSERIRTRSASMTQSEPTRTRSSSSTITMLSIT